MKRLTFFLLLLTLTVCKTLHAQDTLPKFSVKNVGNERIIMGWVNNYSNVKQISIQRSFDSLTGYKTILSVTDPTAQQNGFVDTKATNDHMFYRLYIMLDKGIFLFSDAKKPVLDLSFTTNFPNGTGNLTEIDPGNSPNLINKPYLAGFVPSLYVYTYRDGYVRVSLPANDKPKKYSIKFFEEDDSFLFELKDVKEKTFKIDKTNFYHAGWFKFELYEDGKLFEKHKFYLEKDF
ncbi:MAG: hypothetical protein ABI688_02270 [Bacteroidota bacterium]